MTDEDRQEYLRRKSRIWESTGENGWPLVGIGVLCVVTAAALSLATGLYALPVIVPLMISPIRMPLVLSIVLPAALFIIYNVVTLGRKINDVKSYTVSLTGLVIFLIGSLSLFYYAQSWQYRDVYQSSSTVDAWAILNSICALLTITLWVRAVRHPAPVRAIVSHTAMFVWFFSFAFPLLGESM